MAWKEGEKQFRLPYAALVESLWDGKFSFFASFSPWWIIELCIPDLSMFQYGLYVLKGQNNPLNVKLGAVIYKNSFCVFVTFILINT